MGRPERGVVVRFMLIPFTCACVVLASACTTSAPPGVTGIPSQGLGQPSEGPGQPSDEPSQSDALECETEGFPCSWAEVDPAVLARSRELGRQAADAIASGGTYEEAVASLEAEDGMAQLQQDGNAIRFRLEGGRPVWILEQADEAAAAGDGAATGVNRRQLAVVGSLSGSEPGTRSPQRVRDAVVQTGSDVKTAIILSPFAWNGSHMNAQVIADVLSDTRGYSGGVRHVANATFESSEASDQFEQLAGYGVVFVKSYGGRVCPEGEACHATVAVEAFRDAETHLTEEEAKFQDIIFWPGYDWEMIGVEADYFRSWYPGGLKNALIFFDVPDLADEGLIRAIKGGSSEFYYWAGRPQGHTLDAVAAYVANLAETGRSPEVVYHEMAEALKEGDSTFVGVKPASGGTALRIREIVTLQDGSGADLYDGAGITIEGSLGDGEADVLRINVAVDGITDDEAPGTTVRLSVDDVEDAPQTVAEGTSYGDFQWGLSWAVDMPDIEEGQQIKLEAIAELPDGGTSEHRATVMPGGDPLGSEWQGTVTAVSDTLFPGVTITTTSTIHFVRDPDQRPGDNDVKFLVADGSFVWITEGSSGTCTFEGGPVEVPLRVLNDSDYIEFDITRAAEGLITYYGTVSVPNGPLTVVSKSCVDGPEDYQTEVEGVVWLAPQEEEFLLSGTTAAGSWDRGSVLTTEYTWNFQRTR